MPSHASQGHDKKNPVFKDGVSRKVTDDVAAYVNEAALACKCSADLIGISLENLGEAPAEVGYHTECIERWGRTLSQVGREPKHETVVDTDMGSGVADLANQRETLLEMARRHVREAEVHVARQHQIAAGLPGNDEGSLIARTLLAEFERTLRDHKVALAQLEKRSVE